MRECIDCGLKLLAGVQSLHQPNLRCTDCFRRFALGVEKVFQGKADSARVAAEAAKPATAGREKGDG